MIYTNSNQHTPSERAKNLLYRVYGFMALALCITALVAYYVSSQPAIMQTLFSNRWIVFGFFIAQLALVITISAALYRLSFRMALFLFFLYSALMGVTFSTLILAYTQSSLYLAFFVTSGMFACLALYGYFTKSDLTGLGNYAFMGLIGLILGFLANLYFANGPLDYILTLAGVVIFSILSAYDVQKIKKMSEMLVDQDAMANKIAVLGALTLYLDFINLFLMILRMTGRRNND